MVRPMHRIKDASYKPIRNVKPVRRRLSDGRINLHYYHRPTGTRLPPPGSPGFQEAYEAAERLLVGIQSSSRRETDATKPLIDAPLGSEKFNGAAANMSVTRSEERRSERPASTHSNTESLPLYPDEHQIAFAILGMQRAHEWKGKAALLEREGLPPIDPIMGGRSWRAVRQFFAARDGIEPAGTSVQLSTSRRVRCVPFVPDGAELSDAPEETADPVERDANLPRRTRV
jgi:hypothetical protein